MSVSGNSHPIKKKKKKEKHLTPNTSKLNNVIFEPFIFSEEKQFICRQPQYFNRVYTWILSHTIKMITIEVGIEKMHYSRTCLTCILSTEIDYLI